MPTAAEVRETINQQLRSLVRQLREKQFEYLAMNGRYWQGLRTHDIVPADGIPTAPDLTKKANGLDSWLDLGITLPALTEAAYSVHPYSGPKGDGYAVIAETIWQGVLWKRAANVGPESFRVIPWQRVDATVP